TYQNITFSGSASKTLSGNLTIAGNWLSNTGEQVDPTNSLVYFQGSAAQTLTDGGSNGGKGVIFKKVFFRGGGAKTISSGAFSVATNGVVTMSGSSSLNANGNLTLFSDSTGSATVATIPA